MKILKILSIIITVLVMFVGVLGCSIIFHEGYHYFSIDGEPIGLCVGVCDLQGNYENTGIVAYSKAPAYIKWGLTEEQVKVFDIVSEEKQAWIFTIIMTSVLVIFLFANDFIEWGKDYD